MRYAKSKQATGPSTLFEVREWCEKRVIPEDLATLGDHDVIVPVFHTTEAERLYIFITTKHLSRVCGSADCFQVDGTCKLNIHNYPAIVTGSLDANHKFHGTGFHLIWGPESELVYEEVRLFVYLSYS